MTLRFAVLASLFVAACNGGAVDDVLPPDSGLDHGLSGDGGTDMGTSDAGADAGAPHDAGTDSGEDAATPTVTLSGTVSGAAASAVAAAWSTGSDCGATGVRLVTSGATLSCAAGPLSTQLVKPYLQVDLSAADVATYTAVADGACTTAGHVFSATFDADGISTTDATGGSVTITEHTGTHLRGTLSIDFGTGHVDGTFDVDGC